MYTAVRGGAAEKNGKPIRVSTAPTLRNSLIATGRPYDRADRTRLFSEMDRLYMAPRSFAPWAAQVLGSASWQREPLTATGNRT